MRIFTDQRGNFNWAAVGGICAVIGSALALVTFFMPTGSNATEQNAKSVLIDYVAGDKIVGITLEQYEVGLKRREDEVRAQLEDGDLSSAENETLRAALQQIDARQSSLEQSYQDVALLTADIRSYHENANDPELVKEAIGALFDGDTASAARLSIKAGIPVDSVGTIDSLTQVFQVIETEADFLRYVAGRELTLSNDTFYKATIGKDGSLNGYWSINRVLSGSWAWIDGKYCREYVWHDDHYPEHCATVSATRSAVKITDRDGTTQIYSK